MGSIVRNVPLFSFECSFVSSKFSQSLVHHRHLYTTPCVSVHQRRRRREMKNAQCSFILMSIVKFLQFNRIVCSLSFSTRLHTLFFALASLLPMIYYITFCSSFGSHTECPHLYFACEGEHVSNRECVGFVRFPHFSMLTQKRIFCCCCCYSNHPSNIHICRHTIYGTHVDMSFTHSASK